MRSLPPVFMEYWERRKSLPKPTSSPADQALDPPRLAMQRCRLGGNWRIACRCPLPTIRRSAALDHCHGRRNVRLRCCRQRLGDQRTTLRLDDLDADMRARADRRVIYAGPSAVTLGHSQHALFARQGKDMPIDSSGGWTRRLLFLDALFSCCGGRLRQSTTVCFDFRFASLLQTASFALACLSLGFSKPQLGCLPAFGMSAQVQC